MKIKISAIFAGIGTWILSLIIFTIVNYLFITQIYMKGSPSDFSFDYNVVFGYFLKMISICGYVISGYIAARVAERNELLHGFVLGFLLCLVVLTMTIVQMRLMKYDIPFDLYNLANSFITIIGCMIGAYIQKRIREKKNEEDPFEKRIDGLGQE